MSHQFIVLQIEKKSELKIFLKWNRIELSIVGMYGCRTLFHAIRSPHGGEISVEKIK